MGLREGLNAVGVSEYAIILYADIRGFSDFSDDHESPDVATYIRDVFIQHDRRLLPARHLLQVDR